MSELKYLFDHLNEFERFKEDTNTAILTDIDGTISEIVDLPSDAIVSPLMQEILRKMCKKFKLIAVISGRSIVDIRRMIGIDKIMYVGNHGMEYMRNGRTFVEEDVKKYIPLIKQVTKKIKNDKSCHIDNILFEEKGVTLTIHYRLCKNPYGARKVIIDAIDKIEEINDLKISEGRKVIEIKPKVKHSKGTIFEKIIHEHYLKRVIYLGDDITDADVFDKIKELKENGEIDAEGIVVLSEEIPDYVKENATYYVESVAEVQKFFKWLSED